jgi:hypothetical protein
MTIKLKQLIKIPILIFGISILSTSCEKENTDEIITQEKFNAPTIELAKQFVKTNSNASNLNVSLRNSSSNQISVTHWEGSKTKKYKETEEQNVDILYTPIYVKSTRTDIKGFIASTELDGIIDSRKFYILYKSNDLKNGLNAYILIYGLDGNLQQAYNFENGQSIPLPENNNGNVSNRSSVECDDDVSAMNDEDFEYWWANCNNPISEVVVVANTFSNDGGNNSGSTSAFNDWNSWIYIPANINPNGSSYNNGSTNSNNTPWHSPNVLVANAPSISSILDAAYNSTIANWLREMEQTNQQMLNQIADYLNDNREENPFSDFTIGDIQPEQFPISDSAIQYILILIDFLNDTDSTFDFEEGTSKGNNFVGTEIDCIHNMLMQDTENNFYQQMVNTFATNDFEVLRFDIDDTMSQGWGATVGHEMNTSPWGGFDFYNIAISDNIANSSNISQMLTLSHELIHAHMMNSLDNWGYIYYDANGIPYLNHTTINCDTDVDYNGINLNSLNIQERFVAIICAFNQNNTLSEQWMHQLFNMWNFDVNVYRDKLYNLLLDEHDWNNEPISFRAPLELKFGSQWKEKASEYLSWKGLEATTAFTTWAQENGIDPALNENGDVVDQTFAEVIFHIRTQGKKDCIQN